MAAKLTRLTHKVAIQLHLVAESCTVCSCRSRRSVRKLLDTPSYMYKATEVRQRKMRTYCSRFCELFFKRDLCPCLKYPSYRLYITFLLRAHRLNEGRRESKIRLHTVTKALLPAWTLPRTTPMLLLFPLPRPSVAMWKSPAKFMSHA
jgi:hypothetical protein